MIIQLQFSEIMGCANLFLACAQMKFHKHMRDMRDLLRFKAYFQFNITF